jgi:hypothetical protein
LGNLSPWLFRISSNTIAIFFACDIVSSKCLASKAGLAPMLEVFSIVVDIVDMFGLMCPLQKIMSQHHNNNNDRCTDMFLFEFNPALIQIASSQAVRCNDDTSSNDVLDLGYDDV